MLLDPWVPLESEVVTAMLDLAALKAGELHLDLGSGDGRFLAAAKARGATTIGYEIDAALVTQSRLIAGVTVKQADCFDATADIRKADVVTAWFTVEPYTSQLLVKLQTTMKRNARLVFLYDSRRSGSTPVSDPNWGKPAIAWVPTSKGEVLGNRFWLYVKA
jgi:protein-L-isoaspartate O-methyltransferase